ncbi:MAG: rod shape-determining protein MreD [Elusimicrobia bacterium]|nr:rod shape-determining protein MreD [Elusimicrobiota bacterium]
MRVIEGALLFLGGLVFHWLFSTHLSFWGLSPNVLLLVTVGAAATAGPVKGQCLGFAWGLCLDAMSGHVFGANALGFALVAYIVGQLRRQMDVASPPSQAIVAAAFWLLYAVFYSCVGLVFERRFLWPGWLSFLLDPVYSALVAPFAFSAARRLLKT